MLRQLLLKNELTLFKKTVSLNFVLHLHFNIKCIFLHKFKKFLEFYVRNCWLYRN
jgi:hypothetical protein